MKKFASIALASAMVLSLAACGGSKPAATTAAAAPAPETTAAPAAAPAPETTAAPAAAPEKLMCALVINQNFGDNGPMDNLAAGAEKAAAEFGFELKKIESDPAKFEDDLRAMAEQGANVIVTTFDYMSDATISIAEEYPDVNFAAVYQSINDDTTKYDNIWDVEFHGEQAFYVAGYMAGLYTKSGVVGIQVGGEEASPKAEANGFMKGVYDANPDAVCKFAYAGGYGDPATAKEKAKAMIADGCDFIQNDSGGSNAGVVEAAKEAGIGTAGEITDYYGSYDGFWGIIGIGFGNIAYEAMKKTAEGNFTGGQHSIYGLAEGGYYMDWASYERYAAANADFAPVVEAGKEAEKKIGAGEIVIDYVTDEPQWSAIAGK